MNQLKKLNFKWYTPNDVPQSSLLDPKKVQLC